MKKQDNNLKYYLVLIDTQWNVNTYGSEYAAGADLVLIDTQWNVNVSDCDCVMRTAGFNRYIVEYKFF